MQVTTVDGDVDLKIPSGVQPGTTLVMGKRGVPRLGGSGRGDHMVSHHALLSVRGWQVLKPCNEARGPVPARLCLPGPCWI